MKLVVSEEATADLDRLREFLADKNPAAAQRAVAAIVNAVRSLAAFPSRGRPLENAGTRDLIVPFGRSAYIIRYAHLADADEIVIVRIWHSREERR